MLASATGWAAHAVETAGYPALTLAMLASPPLPSEGILPLAGFLVGRGDLAFPLALLAATIGALGNACAVYAIARWGGRPLLRRLRWVRLDDDRLDRLEQWFGRHGAITITLGRMVSVVRWLVGIPAGAARMPMRRYVPLTAVGCTGWNSLLLGAGWALGRGHGTAGPRMFLASAALALMALTGSLIARARSGG